MRKPATLILCLLVVGCGASRPIPDWLLIGHGQLERYKHSFLAGKKAIADSQFKRAVAEVKLSGDLTILARLYLTRMAVQTAVLERPETDEYLTVDRLDQDPGHRAFHSFLLGETDQVVEHLLPEQYRGVHRSMRASSSGDAQVREIEAIEDPLSRLIATGVLVQSGRENEALLEKAVATASGQGWKKALLAYLERLSRLYDARGEKEKARNIEKRTELIRD